MKVIIKPRGYGKTTELILIAARTGKPILVATDSMKRYIKSRAKDMEIYDITCFSVKDIINLKHKGIITNFSKDFLVDEFDCVFEEFMRHYGIRPVLGTTTLEGWYRRDYLMKIHTDEKENYKKKIDKMKDDMARRNKEIQKERERKKK